MLDRCPKAWLASIGFDVIATIGDVRNYHRRGTLPEAGGWLDQHPHWIQAESIIAGMGYG